MFVTRRAMTMASECWYYYLYYSNSSASYRWSRHDLKHASTLAYELVWLATNPNACFIMLIQ